MESIEGQFNKPESIIEEEGGVKNGEDTKIKERREEGRKRRAMEKYQPLKNERMERLTQSLRAIDKGENIEEFNGERRIVYYDDHLGFFYVMEEGKKKGCDCW